MNALGVEQTHDSAKQPARRWLILEPLRPAQPWNPICVGDVIVHGRFAQLECGVLDRVAPDAVLAPLMAPEWDVLDLAAVLTRSRFKGLLMVVAPPLPSAALVEAEVRALFPTLRFALIDRTGVNGGNAGAERCGWMSEQRTRKY